METKLELLNETEPWYSGIVYFLSSGPFIAIAFFLLGLFVGWSIG